MCGIAGILGHSSPEELAALSEALAHRGPDGEGFFRDEAAGVGLVHRRLAIIDPTAAAAQPMESCGGRYTIVFNGEIYNFPVLAEELAGRGYSFNMHSDTAVIGPLYDRHGLDCLARLDGIFAFALWDARERELIVARDALGVKPLYYTQAGGRLAFASELKALLAIAGAGREIDHAALADYLVRLWSPGPGTMLRDVRKLPPGHVLRVKGGRVELSRWYSPPVGRAPRRSGDAATLTAEVRDTLSRVVGEQCLSDVPIGAFLSGGVDSSAVVAAMVAGNHRPAQTYCIGFEGPSMTDEGFGDDLAHARLVANRLGVPLREIRVEAPDADALERLVWTLDEPEADPAALYVGAICEAARADGIKVLLGGTGGDDIFSGYRRHKAAALRARLGAVTKALPLGWLGRRAGSGALGRRLDKLAYLLGGTDDDFLLRAFEFNRSGEALACLTQDAKPPPEAADWLSEALAVSGGASLLERMLHLELHGFLPDHNLNYTDKASMAHGVEVRVPYLGTALVELASRIPWQLKTRGLEAKWLLKAAVADWLPPEVINRPKTGFGAPVRQWLAHGKLTGLARELLISPTTLGRGLFEREAVTRLLDDTTTGRRDGAYLVLALMMVELWMRRFVDRASVSAGGSTASHAGPPRVPA